MSALPTETQVLITGAGPTGLVLGIALRQQGIECMIIDRLPSPLPWSRALGLHARTLEIFDALGVLGEVEERSLVQKGVNVHGEGGPLFRLDLTTLDAPFPWVLSCPQAAVEEVLAARFRELGGLVVRDCELLDLAQGTTGVEAKVRFAEREESVRSRFLIGCDGARSRVRELLGFGFEGARYPDHFLLADLDIHWDLDPESSHGFLLSAGALIALPMPEGWRLIINEPAEEELAPEPELEPFRRRLAQALGEVPPLGAPRWLSRFSVHRRLAEHYRRNRVLLAGDAAHIQSPLGAQGMNTGIGDAFNLGWKLALYLEGRGDGRLLDTYEQERRPVARRMLYSVDLLSRSTLARNRPFRYIRDTVLRFAGRRPETGRRLLRQASQLDVHYRATPFTGQGMGLSPRSPGPHPGDRMPDARLDAVGRDETVRLQQWLRRGRFCLVAQLGGEAREHTNVLSIHALANRLGQDFEGRVAMELVIAEQLPGDYRGLGEEDFPGVGIWRDLRGEFRARYGEHDQLWLMRPDGHLAWRGAPADADRLLEWLESWLRRR